MENPIVAVVGATGAVGREMIEILEQREFAVGELRPLASSRSAGTSIEFRGDEIVVEELTEQSFKGVDIALFSAGGSISEKYGPVACESGAVVIDNSSKFRMTEGIPLIVPEVNADELRSFVEKRDGKSGFLIANPNCSTAQLVVVLKPILDEFGLQRVVVSTYQSVSGAGQKGMDELWEQTRGIYATEEVQPAQFQKQIAFNCIPHIDVFLDNLYTKEEVKMIDESRKILNIPDLRFTATAVRVPVFSCHSESVNIQTDKPFSLAEMNECLRSAPGLVLMDEPKDNLYPTPAELGGTDSTYVGRVRLDESAENALNMWVVADNLRKGAALNAVQIAELVVAILPASN